jgi:hypothetical protein
MTQANADSAFIRLLSDTVQKEVIGSNDNNKRKLQIAYNKKLYYETILSISYIASFAILIISLSFVTESYKKIPVLLNTLIVTASIGVSSIMILFKLLKLYRRDPIDNRSWNLRSKK